MFGIPQMIRAITGTIVTVFSEADKAVTTLAKSNEVWHQSTDKNLNRNVKSAVLSKAVEIEKEIEKSKNQLNSIKPGLAEQLEAELEEYFNTKNKD